jgi:hypothetical protein
MAIKNNVPTAPAEVVSTNLAPVAEPTANSPAQASLAKANKAVSTNASPSTKTDTVDSVGKPKEAGKPAPMGPRGVNKPRDVVPAPQMRKADQTKNTVTDKVDSAGNEKVGAEVDHHIGIRGTHTSRDTYKLDK